MIGNPNMNEFVLRKRPWSTRLNCFRGVREVQGRKKQQESSIIDQHSKATEEIRSLKELLAQKEAHSCKMVMDFTQATEYLDRLEDKARSLKCLLNL